MYIKWIVCHVKKGFKVEFARAQEQWIKIQNAKGFIGQIGGWDLKNQHRAVIIGFWENQDAYKAFMLNIHDEIFQTNKQSEYYDFLENTFFSSLLFIDRTTHWFMDALQNAKMFQMDDYFVDEKSTNHFEQVQKSVCNHEMRRFEDILGTVFSKCVNHSFRYLILTFLNSCVSPKKNLKFNLDLLKTTVDIRKDIKSISTHQILLVDTWKVFNPKTIY